MIYRNNAPDIADVMFNAHYGGEYDGYDEEIRKCEKCGDCDSELFEYREREILCYDCLTERITEDNSDMWRRL